MGGVVTAQEPLSAPRLTTLTSGVRLILKPELTAETVAFTVFVRMEPDLTPQEDATGDLVARALFFGSLNRSYEAVEEAVARVGGSLETLRTPDYVVITCITVASQVREAAYLLSEALKNADFAPDALQRARKEGQEERRRRAETPFQSSLEALRQAFRPFSEPDEAQWRRVTTPQAQAYFRSRYVAERTVIAVVGRFDPAIVTRSLDNNLFDYDRRSSARFRERPHFTPPAEIRAKPRTVVVSGQAAYALVGTLGPKVTEADYPAFLVLQCLLGVGHGSRLYQEAREKLGLGYEVGAIYFADRADPLTLYLQWSANRKENEGSQASTTALALLHAQLDSVTARPPDDMELTRARSMAIGRDALRHERVRDKAFLLGWYEVMGAGFGFDARLPGLLAAVTREDVLRVARAYLARRSAVLALPAH
jgi:predicted Zn-dependent peptidase